MLATIIEIMLTCLVLVGVIKEEKLVEFEDKMLDKFAKSIADRINRRRAEELAQQRAEKMRSRIHIVKAERGNSSAPNLFIA